jgi:NAD(P)-dependent dehydrogenase (short-subunit alcohol dehydrogenase family)
MHTTDRVALVIGAGDATGGSIARRFAREGFAACVTRRSLDKLQPLVDQIVADGGAAHGFASDARKEDEVVALVEQIESTIGPINTGFIRDNFPERYPLKSRMGILNPDHIADQYWMLHAQPRDAWTHELDLRPWMEKF